MRETKDTPRAEIDELVRLQKEVKHLELVLGRAAAKLQHQESELNNYRAQVAWFSKQLFGPKAERTPDGLEAAWNAFIDEQKKRASQVVPPIIDAELSSVQLLLGLLDPGAPVTAPRPAEAPAPSAPPPAPTPSQKKRSKHGRRRLTELTQADPIILEPLPGEVPDGARSFGVDLSYRLGVRPAEVVAYPIIRPQYAVDREDGTTRVITAPPPDEMIPRGLFAPSGLAHVIAQKWDRHIPFHRLSSFFAHQDYRLSTSTLSGASIRAAATAKTLVAAMEAYAKEVAPYLAIDATGAPLQHPKACLRGHTWVRYIEEVCVLVSFTKTHDAVTAGAQLDGWTCPTVGDGTSVYDRKHRETRNDRGGCLAHGRRKLIYAAPTDGRALPGIKMMNDLFELERGWVGLSDADRRAERQKYARPIVDQLFSWRDGLLSDTSLAPRGLLARALRYLRNQAERLSYFLENGAVPIHNNAAELQLRHFAVGRKNWLFYGSEAGAEAGSIWLSLVLSARMHQLPVEKYLRELFRVLPSWPKRGVIELAPHRWKETRARLIAEELERELGPIKIPPPLAR